MSVDIYLSKFSRQMVSGQFTVFCNSLFMGVNMSAQLPSSPANESKREQIIDHRSSLQKTQSPSFRRGIKRGIVEYSETNFLTSLAQGNVFWDSVLATSNSNPVPTLQSACG